MVPKKGLEPSTFALQEHCTTNCATSAYLLLEHRVGFEPTVLGICNPLHWAALPPVHIWYLDTVSNRGPSACKADALPLSYPGKHF
jgi:hypothetical protein